jgi:hypothetical protein
VELKQFNDSPDQACAGDSVQVFESKCQVLHKISNFSKKLLFIGKVIMMGVPSDFVINPPDVSNGHDGQNNISKQANRWKCVSSSNFLEKHQLKYLT